jgi:hypothetical protein
MNASYDEAINPIIPMSGASKYPGRVLVLKHLAGIGAEPTADLIGSRRIL